MQTILNCLLILGNISFVHLKIANLNKFLSNCLHKNLEKHFLMALITTKFSKSQKRDAAKQAKYLHNRAVGRSENPGRGRVVILVGTI